MAARGDVWHIAVKDEELESPIHLRGLAFRCQLCDLLSPFLAHSAPKPWGSDSSVYKLGTMMPASSEDQRRRYGCTGETSSSYAWFPRLMRPPRFLPNNIMVHIFYNSYHFHSDTRDPLKKIHMYGMGLAYFYKTVTKINFL